MVDFLGLQPGERVRVTTSDGAVDDGKWGEDIHVDREGKLFFKGILVKQISFLPDPSPSPQERGRSQS